MRSGRRTFLRRLGGGLAGTLAAGRVRLAGAQADPPSWDDLRAQFTLTRDRMYLNNGTIGPSPVPVQEAVRRTMEELDRRGEYDGWEIARPKIAAFVHAAEKEIALTHNTTEGINIVASGLPLRSGDEVIVTTHEHAGNALPWLNRMRRDGIVLKTFQPGLRTDDNLNRIDSLCTPRTRVIAVPHITCTAGTVLPVREIARLGRGRGIWVALDGAHAPGMMPLDVAEIGCDFYAACGHKWMCGPRGSGFLYVREEVLDVLQPVWIGAYSDTGWDLSSDPPALSGYVPTAHRFDFGTQSAPQSAGLAAAVDFLTRVGTDRIWQRDLQLAGRLQAELLALGDRVEMLTPVEDASRGAMVGFRLKNVPYDAFGAHAAKRGFRIRLVPEGHLNAVRVSTHFYNSPDEVDMFVEAVKEVA